MVFTKLDAFTIISHVRSMAFRADHVERARWWPREISGGENTARVTQYGGQTSIGDRLYLQQVDHVYQA